MTTAHQSHGEFFRERFPLIWLFECGQDVLLYDAKPHFAVVFSDEEMAVLCDFLSGQSEEDILRKHAGALAGRETEILLQKISELREAGVFLEGPAEEVSPVDRDAVREQIDRFQESVLLRKFCLSVTDDCNFRCAYCKRTLGGEEMVNSRTALSEENAFLAIDYYFENYIAIFKKLPPSKQVTLLESSPPCLSWYGGEPFLNFPVIRSSAAYFKKLPWQDHGIPGSVLRFTANTNLSVLNDEIIRFLIDNQVLLFASLDGPAEEHDRCRVFANGRGTFSAAYRNLMRIKEADETYFRTHVSIFAVYTPEHDRERCASFNRAIGALRCEQFAAEFTGTFVQDPDNAVQVFEQSMAGRIKAFKTAAASAAQAQSLDVNQFANLFPFSQLRLDDPHGSQCLNLLLTCPMGFDNLMVGANGDFVICHKVGKGMPIGSSRTGLDTDRLIGLYQHYNSTVNCDACRNCWAVRFCPACAASRMDGDRFVNPKNRECDHLRQRIAYDFFCFIHLSQEHPQLLDRILDHTRDRKSFVGIIDIHDF